MSSISSSVSYPFPSVSSARLLSCGRFFYVNPWPTSSSNLPVSKPYHLRAPAAPTSKTSSSIAATPFDLSPPPIDLDLLEDVTTAGGKVSDDGVVQTFHNDDEAMDAFENGAVVVDLSHFGRIKVSGDDRIQFLHNQSTANFECLHEGQGCDTVFVTPTARTIDIAHAWFMRKSVLLTVSPVTCEAICGMLNKYIFMTDRVEIQDITKQTSLLVLVGPKSDQIMKELNLAGIVGKSYGTHQHYSVNGMPVTVGVGSFISHKGYSIMTSPAAAGSIWKTLCSLGATPTGADAWEKLRIIQGRPAPEKELTNEFNVLEAGLWDSISLNKGIINFLVRERSILKGSEKLIHDPRLGLMLFSTGCYKGQETISRLITYDGVKQKLWGLSLSASVEPGSPITVGGQKVGKVTSYAAAGKKAEHFALAYIKRRAASAGDCVTVGDETVGRVVEVPFLAPQRPTPKP